MSRGSSIARGARRPKHVPTMQVGAGRFLIQVKGSGQTGPYPLPMTVEGQSPLQQFLGEIRRNPLLWFLVALVPLFAVYISRPTAHIALFILAVVAVVPLAALISLC